jgi:hypothetical protein
MRHPRRPPQKDEPNLFSPPPAIPEWQALPAETRQVIRQLLAQMLQPDRTTADAQEPPMEVADE